MTQRGYRKLARGLFILLFVVFILLYFLLRGEFGANSLPKGWGIHHAISLGTVEISDVLSSGFILDELEFKRTTSLTQGAQFSDSVVHVTAKIKNIAEVPVAVKMRVTGTNISDDRITNAGLHCFLYYFSGKDDPFPDGFQQILQASGNTMRTVEMENGLTLTTDPDHYPTDFELQAGEEIQLMLSFWIDHDALLAKYPNLIHQVGDLETDIINGQFSRQYNVTVKLTSRAAKFS
ncbi:MAG: hypothetical protein RRY64_01040 [Oscillospiraceae bacterium]